VKILDHFPGALSAYEAKFFISLFERAFKVMKNGFCFVVMALLVAELLEILICANWMTCDVAVWTQSGAIKSQN